MIFLLLCQLMIVENIYVFKYLILLLKTFMYCYFNFNIFNERSSLFFKRKYCVEFINSSVFDTENTHVFELELNNKLDLLYFAPKTLFTTNFQNILPQLTISLFVIDKPYCI